MAFDENFESREERKVFDEELDDYLSKRSRKKKVKPAKRIKPNGSVEVIEKEPIHRKIIRKIKTVFIVEEEDGFEEPHEVEREVIEEVIVDEPELPEPEYDEEETDEKRHRGWLLAFIRRLFASKKWEKEDEEVFEESTPQEQSKEFFENELKAVFELANKTIKLLPRETLLKVKSMPEFENYKQVIKRYNERKLREGDEEENRD